MIPSSAPTARSGARAGPYAIAALAGSVWHDETGENQNMLARHEPKTQRFASWPTPSAGGGPALTLSGMDKIALVTISPASPGY